ncbi:hypothetical protein KY359_03130 [Candidatus Woesearchaeota archaeon]|nr:hypothetical protein [Candidatus Woesearchaeota archaeon]
MVVTAGLAAVCAIANPGKANAETGGPAPVMIPDLVPQVRQHACDYEQTALYRNLHPSDHITCFDDAEMVRVAALGDAYRSFALDTHIAYLISRGPGYVEVSAGARFGNLTSVYLGSAPVFVKEIVSGFSSTSVDTAISQIVSQYYSDESDDTKARMLEAMHYEAAQLGDLASGVITGKGRYINPQILLAAEAARGDVYSSAPAAPAVPPAPAVTAPVTPVSPPPAAVPQPPAVPEAVLSPTAPVETAPVAPVAPVETAPTAPVETAPAVTAPVAPTAPVETAPAVPPAPVDPCVDPAFSETLDDIAASYRTEMDGHAPADDVRSHAEDRYNALTLQCPGKTDEIAQAMVDLDHAIDAYIAAETDRVRPTLFTAGGAWLGGEGISHSGLGHLHVDFGNLEGASSPLHGGLYLDGGNVFADTVAAPFGGAIFNIGGRSYELRLSWGGVWMANASEYSLDPVTSVLTEAIPDGSILSTTVTNESGNSSTDGYQPNWLAAAELAVRIAGNWQLRLGIGGGQDRTVVRDEQDVSVSTTEEGSTHTDSPPAVDVAWTAGADVNTHVLNVTAVDTMLLNFLVGLDYHRQDSPWTVGGSVLTFLAFPRTTIDTAIDTTTNILDVNTTIDIEGFPTQTETTPGSTSTTSDPSHQRIDDVYDVRVVPMGGFDYLTETMAFRLRMGPVLGGDQNGYHSSDLPVLGNGSAYFLTHGMSLGANTVFHSNQWNLEGFFATGGDFQRYVSFMNARSDMVSRSLVQDRLALRYVDELTRNLITGGEGFIAIPGLRVESDGSISGYGSLAYVHQFDFGPLGIMGFGDSATGTGGGNLIVPLGLEGLGALLGGHYTHENHYTGEPEWGVGATISYTPGGNR